MPSTINLYQIGVWFCVGFFTGAGWAIAAWLVGADLLPYLSANAAAERGRSKTRGLFGKEPPSFGRQCG